MALSQRRRRSYAGGIATRLPSVLEPARWSYRRRRRRRWPLLLALLLAVGLAAGAYLLYRENEAANRRAAERRLAQSFTAAWRHRDYGAMWAMLTPASRARHPRTAFAASYRRALAASTARLVRLGPPVRIRDQRFRVRMLVRTRMFGTFRGTRVLQLAGSGRKLGVSWAPTLVFPLLRSGERLHRRTLSPGRPAPILATDGSQLVSPRGTVRPGAPHGTLGALAKAYRRRLHGRAGGVLYAGRRPLRRVPVVHPRPVQTTLDRRIQLAANLALGDRYGGIAVLRPSDGAVLALSGIASSAPQPPGSTFKIVTTTAALAAGVATPASSFPVAREATIEGRSLANARGEACGGTLVQAFAESCNSVFAPLGARVGARRLVATAERFGFNEPPPIPYAARSTIPSAGTIGDSLAVAASAIGQGRVQATALQMASVAAAIGNRGLRVRPRLVVDAPRHVRRVAGPGVVLEVAAMMRAVVASGTGTAAQIAGVTVAGKTGTAEIGTPAPSTPSTASDTDAWFVAYAPAEHPTVAVGVLLVRAGFGGDTAAPLARQVLLAALGRS